MPPRSRPSLKLYRLLRPSWLSLSRRAAASGRDILIVVRQGLRDERDACRQTHIAAHDYRRGLHLRLMTFSPVGRFRCRGGRVLPAAEGIVDIDAIFLVS